MKIFAIILAAVLLAGTGRAETEAQLQQKLQAAQAEIESLKSKLTAMQVQQAHSLPPTRPLEQALGVAHPIVTADELAAYGAHDPAAVRQQLKGKVISVTGTVNRFSEGLGRGFKVFLNTGGSTMQIGAAFHPPSSVKSTFTAEDGSEMVIDDERRGRYTLTALNESVIISGFFENVTRRQVSLGNCVLQKP
ncbi:MAG: hypothetical protein ABIT76_03015 [Chthoniobacterales bacterium]